MLPTPASLVADMHLATVVTSGIPCSFGQKLALPRHLSGKRLVDRADHLCTCKAWGQGTFIETASWIPSYTGSYVRADVPAGSQRKYSCKPISPVQVLSALSLSHTAPIQPIGLRLWRIDGDGRCLFRALAQGTHQLDKGKYWHCRCNFLAVLLAHLPSVRTEPCWLACCYSVHERLQTRI